MERTHTSESIVEPHLSHPRYRPDIDGLRAVAILSVVAFHAFPTWMKGGFIGVDVFFVISGYLISAIIFEGLEKGTFSFSQFYSRRIRRIFPALVLVLAACYVLGWFALLADEYEQLGKHIASGAGFVANIVLLTESSYFNAAAETKPLLHLWSLGVEEQFYIIYPFLLWSAWKKKYNLLLITATIAVISFCLNMVAVMNDAVSAFFPPQTRFWELMCGSLLAWSPTYKNGEVAKPTTVSDRWLAAVVRLKPKGFDGRALANVTSFLGLLLLMYGFSRFDRGMSYPGGWALVPVLGSVLIIYAGQQAWINRTILASRALVWFGLISFPLYLWHWPLLAFARVVESEMPPIGIRIAAVALSVLLAWLTYRFIERYFRSSAQAEIKVATLVALMIVVASMGVYSWNNQGLPLRESIRDVEERKQSLAFTQDLGRPSSARIMLLGDSHAAHLVPGLKKYLGQNVADFTAPGCIPFYDVDRYDSRTVPGSCLQIMTGALLTFERNSQMTGIILSSMGPVYLSGEVFKSMDFARVMGDGVKLGTDPGLTDRWEIYSRGMRDTFQRLTAANKKILFVIDIPELGFDPKACMSRPFSPSRKPRCAVARADYDDRVKRYRALIEPILREFPNVMVYDPINDFCDREYCWATKDGRFLYRDTDHLSDEGSDFLVERILPLIERLM